MSWSTGLTAVSDLLNSGSSLGNWIFNMVNYKDMKNREDTAVQRRAADLAAAGMSKTLAAGSAAGSSYSALSAPSVSNQTASAILDVKRLDSEIEKNDATVENIEADTKNKNDQNVILKKEAELLNDQVFKSNLESRILGATAPYRLDIARNNTSVDYLQSIIEKNIADYANNTFSDYYNPVTRANFYASGAGWSQGKADKMGIAFGKWLQDVSGISSLINSLRH